MQRADICLTNLKLTRSRTYAKKIILDKRAFCNGKLILKPSQLVDENNITVKNIQEDKYVGRGAIKLKYAIDKFKLSLDDKICMDIGSSTGGFTQIMLLNNAKIVYSIDVGTNQLVDFLRNDKRVISLENTNFRNLSFDRIKTCVDFVSIDVSFISIRYIFENLHKFLNNDTLIVALIKPQFECGVKGLSKGIVKSKKVLFDVIENVKEYALINNLQIINIIESPILGTDGNKEFLALIRGKF